MKAFKLAAGVAAMVMVAGCASSAKESSSTKSGAKTREALAGHLVIAGGALKVENAPLYLAMLERRGEGGKIGILPTASGVPEESGPGSIEDFVKHGGADVAEVIDITMNNMVEAANPAKAEQIRSHNSIWFTGGVQSRIIDAFRPASGDTVGYEALQAVLRKGGVIGGTSAGAAMMSDPCIHWGNSAEAVLIGLSDAEDAGVKVGKGMGFFPFGLTDQHFIRRGRLGRLVAALEETGQQYGFGVEENRAILVDLAKGESKVIGGDRGLIFVDMTEASRTGLRREGIRVSLLSDGDAVLSDENGATLRSASDNVTFAPPADCRPIIGETRWDKKAWDNYVVAEALEGLATECAPTIVVSDENFDVKFGRDTRTTFSKTPRGGWSVLHATMTIEPKPHAEKAAADLKAKLSAPKPPAVPPAN